MGNGEAKELVCMTHGHEPMGGNAGGRGYRAEVNKGEKKLDNCNSIINKTYFFKMCVLKPWPPMVFRDGAFAGNEFQRRSLG